MSAPQLDAILASANQADYKRGYTDGTSAAYFNLPCYAPSGASGDYARGYEDGYDRHWEHADKLREHFGVEE